MLKIITLMMFLSFSAFAALDSEVTVVGTVIKFDAKTVTLLETGNKMVIDRAMVPKEIKIKNGMRLTLAMKMDDALKMAGPVTKK